MYYVYFIRSQKNQKVYTGMTGEDPALRLKEHNQKSNKFTSQNGPFKLLYYEEYLCKEDALKREKFYKSGFGRKIRDLIISSISAKGGSASG